MIDREQGEGGEGKGMISEASSFACILQESLNEAPFCMTELQISVENDDDDDGGGDGRKAASTNPLSRENR